MAKDLVVIATPLGGTITQIGSDIARGVWVEDASWEHSIVDHGALRAQFTLRRRPEQEWPDLQPFTPIVIMKSGSVAWSGRVQETPTSRGMDNLITVQCEGWPMHMKDDATQKLFVHNDMAAYRDARAIIGTSGVYPSAYQVDLGGQIVIRVPNGTTVGNTSRGAVTYDAGQFSTVAAFSITFLGGGLAGFALKYFGGDTPLGSSESGTLSGPPIAVASTTTTVNFTTPRRYVTFYMDVNALTNVAVDTAYVNITNINLYGSASYTGGNISILKASNVVTAILPYATKVSQSVTGVSATSFNIPHFSGPATSPADYIDAANAYHLYQWFLKDDAAGGPPRLIYQPIPTSPTVIANVGAGIVFEDASRNDGGDIYNRVLVDYTDSAGNAALEERQTSGLPAAIADPDIVFDVASGTGTQPTNGDFETPGGPPAVGWSAFAGGFARDLTQFDTGVASGLLTTDGSGTFSIGSSTLTGLIPGWRYRLQYRIRRLAAWAAGNFIIDVTTGTGATGYASDTYNAVSLTVGVWTTKTLDFVAQVGSPSPNQLAIQSTVAAAIATPIFNIDNVQILQARPTIADRQGFLRTRVLTTSSRLTAAAADQIGDVFLQAHRFTPLRGTLTVQGSALRTMTGDVPIPAHLIARRLGDAVLINETDPDLGLIGRVGNISNVAYDEPSDTAVVAIDNRKDFIDALLARLAVFTGSS